MRSTSQLLALALAAALLSACGGGGGGGGGTVPVTPVAPVTNVPAAKQDISFTLFIPAAPAGSVRTPKYLPSSTQSVKIVETDNGGTPNAPVVQNTTAGSPGCAAVSGGLSCTITVAASVGSDVFAVSAYDAPNAGGNVLSTGTVSGTVQSGVANSFPLTLSGHVATVNVLADESVPPIGTSTRISVQAKDASGNTIIGAYDSPITLSVNGAAANLSTYTLYNSSDVSTLSLNNSQITPFQVSGAAGSASGNITITPGSNIVYYNIGNGPNDYGSFQIRTGIDNHLYYTTYALPVCASNGFCGVTQSNAGQFDPSTGSFTEFALAGGAVEPYQTADGTVWLPYAVSDSNDYGTGYIAKISGGFSAANLTPIPLPTVSPNPNRVLGSHPRSIALGSDNNLYVTGNTDHQIYRVPLTAAASTDITAISPGRQPAAPGGPVTGNFPTNPQGIAAGSDGNLYIANHQAFSTSMLQYNPGTNVFADFQLPYPSESQEARYVAQGADGNMYISANPSCLVEPCGGALAKSAPGGPLSAIALPDQFSAPDDVASGPNALAFADLGLGGVGTYSYASGEVRVYPVIQGGAGNALYDAGIDAAPETVTYYNGDVWLMTYSHLNATSGLAIGHMIVTSGWTIWPSNSISLIGTGAINEQVIGLMETGNSGPFTIVSNNPSVATMTPIAGASHNFELTGVGPGSTSIRITDAHGRSEYMIVDVTSTTGTVQARPGKHSSHFNNGGSI